MILRRCLRAIADQARTLVVDAVIPAGNAPHPPGKVMDILMMISGKGWERTEQFNVRFKKGNLKVADI